MGCLISCYNIFFSNVIYFAEIVMSMYLQFTSTVSEMPFGTQVGQKSFIPRTLTTDETEGVWGKNKKYDRFPSG